MINADASAGEAKVRVSDARRQPINGFDYDECETFSGNSVTHPVTWAGKSLNALRGQVIRLEFYLDDADLYSFRAAPVQNGTSGDESSSNGSSSNSSSSSFSSSSRSGCSGSPG